MCTRSVDIVSALDTMKTGSRCASVVTTVYKYITKKIRAKNTNEYLESIGGLLPKDWRQEAYEFLNFESIPLMSSYFRGTQETLKQTYFRYMSRLNDPNNTEWMVGEVESIRDKCSQIEDTVSNDSEAFLRIHRLRVFPAFVAIQFLPEASTQTAFTLSDEIAVLLKQAAGAEGDAYNKSGFWKTSADQFHQIVGQILTDQLLRGPTPWSRLVVSGSLIAQFIDQQKIALEKEWFSTANSLGLQFLAYYAESLKPEYSKALDLECAGTQRATILKHLMEVGNSKEPNLWHQSDWTKQLIYHLENSQKDSLGIPRLMHQSSMAIMAHRFEDFHLTSPLLQACCRNNLLAAYASTLIGGADEDDRIGRVAGFLSDLSITRNTIESSVSESPDNHFKSFVMDGLAPKIEDKQSSLVDDPVSVAAETNYTDDRLAAKYREVISLKPNQWQESVCRLGKQLMFRLTFSDTETRNRIIDKEYEEFVQRTINQYDNNQ